MSLLFLLNSGQFTKTHKSINWVNSNHTKFPYLYKYHWKRCFSHICEKHFSNTNKTSSNKKNIGTKNTQTHAKATRVIVFLSVCHTFSFPLSESDVTLLPKAVGTTKSSRIVVALLLPFYYFIWALDLFIRFSVFVYVCVLTLLLFIRLDDDEKV